MLMKFRVSNFTSFGYKEDNEGNVIPTEYHLYAGLTEKHKERVFNYGKRRILNFSAIYGANASGKTNLTRAIDVGKNIVVKTIKNLGLRNYYCRNSEFNSGKPTMFEYEFTIGDKCYAYGFTVNLKQEKILSEWLYKLNDASQDVVFERVIEGNKYFFDESIFKEENVQQFKYYIEDANRIDSTLLVYEINRRRIEDEDYKIFNCVYNWFRLKLIVLYPETRVANSFRQFSVNNKRLLDLLSYFDTGITKYNMRELKESAWRQYFADENIEDFLPDNFKHGILKYDKTLFEVKRTKESTEVKKLMFQHGTDDTAYEFGEESDGTQRLIELLDVILNESKDMVFIIDELDRSFHPQMTIKFVETFLKWTMQKNTQLIITTHESNLMDLNILRRDEIWFAEKENDNTTKLYTLEKFKIRYDKVINKDYLAGRYGAVPVFKDFDYLWGEDKVNGEIESKAAF